MAIFNSYAISICINHQPIITPSGNSQVTQVCLADCVRNLGSIEALEAELRNLRIPTRAKDQK